MNKVRALGFVVVGMVLAFALMLGIGAAWAQGPMWGPNGMMGMMGKNGDMAAMRAQMQSGDMAAMHAQMQSGDMAAMHAQMQSGDMAAMHAQMHNGEAMPEACQAMMSDPEMRSEMMQRMHSGTPMSLEEAKEWMTENDIPADVQAECLAHMAEHHPDVSETPAP